MSDTIHPALKWLRLANDEPSDVVFGCLAAIISSTFLALHLNVDVRLVRLDGLRHVLEPASGG